SRQAPGGTARPSSPVASKPPSSRMCTTGSTDSTVPPAPNFTHHHRAAQVAEDQLRCQTRDMAAPSTIPSSTDVRPPRDRMVRAAAKLFRVHGVTATGLREIVEAADAPRGSLQHYFPGGKE